MGDTRRRQRLTRRDGGTGAHDDGDRPLRGTAALSLLTLAACTPAAPPAQPEASAAIAAAAGGGAELDAVERLPDGKTLQEFYACVETDLTAAGRMRRDVAPADAPYTTDDLVRDFANIALNDRICATRTAASSTCETPALLRRWDQAGAGRGDHRRLDLARGRRARPRQRRRLHPAARAPDRPRHRDDAGRRRELPGALHGQRRAQRRRRPDPRRDSRPSPRRWRRRCTTPRSTSSASPTPCRTPPSLDSTAR